MKQIAKDFVSIHRV